MSRRVISWVTAAVGIYGVIVSFLTPGIGPVVPIASGVLLAIAWHELRRPKE
jgi:hypothetical protein